MKRTARGFTIVETLVASAILAMFFAGILIIVQMLLRSMGEARLRLVAASLAQEKLEIAKNLPFDDVGTVGGIPPGALDQTEVVLVNGQNFLITTSVVYIDDAFDGLAPSDPIPTDYKRVRVMVDWTGTLKPKNPYVMSTDIVPPGLEFIENAGTLYIQVFDSQGLAVSNASIHIVGASLNPPIDLTTTTNIDGTLMLPGSPECVECYEITVTKSGYSTDKTYSTTEVANPSKPFSTVLEGQLTQVSFAIDRLSTLVVTTTRSRQTNYATFPGVQFTLRGTKTIGSNAFDEPVYKFMTNYVTGALGQVSIPNLEWDSYHFILPVGSSIDIAGSKPLSPFPIVANSANQMTVVTTANTTNSLLVTALSNTDQLLPNAVISLFDQSVPIATLSAGPLGKGDEGQAYFGGLLPKTYDLLVTLDGYNQATGSLMLSGDTLESIILSPN